MTMAFLGLASLLCGCSVSRSEQEPRKPDLASSKPQGEAGSISLERPPSIPDLASGKTAPPTPEEFNEQLGDYGRKWFYGGGIGRTMVNVGTAVAFPPYLIYLVGNAGLAMAGYEPLCPADLLPETPREYVLTVYNGVTSVPGRVTALIAGKEFQSN